MKTGKILLFIALIFIVTAVTVNQAGASSLEFSMDIEYSGGTNPAGPDPWATATFVDNGINNVTLTMSTANLVGSEFISVWLFNFDPDLNPDLLTFSLVGTPGSLPNSINTGSNAFKAGPSRFYDIEFDFPQSNKNASNRFTAVETVVYDMSYTGTETIDVYSFFFESTAATKMPSFYSAAHIQSIGPDDGSGWVGSTTVVPEPISSTLFLAGGATFGLRRLRKKRKTSRKRT